MSLESKIEAFWRWFEANAALLAMKVPARPVMSGLNRKLQTLAKGLVAELDTNDEGKHTLVISAQGNKALFGLVMRLVAMAPPKLSWQVKAFRPGRSSHLALAMGRERLATDDLWITYQQGAEGWLDLVVYVPKLNQTSKGLVLLLLDHTVGEYQVATKIGRLEVREKQEEDKTSGLVPFIRLPQIVNLWPTPGLIN